eukprot:8338000-Pyramimonas_sp.AAC.1
MRRPTCSGICPLSARKLEVAPHPRGIRTCRRSRGGHCQHRALVDAFVHEDGPASLDDDFWWDFLSLSDGGDSEPLAGDEGDVHVVSDDGGD